jgi:outer membrane protein
MVKKAAIICLLALYNFGISQENMDWYSCLDYALQNNLFIKQSKLQESISDLGIKQAKYNFTPNINVSSSYTLSFGRSLDFSTYQFVNQTVQNANGFLSVNQPIFEGLKNWYAYDKAKLELAAAQQDIITIQDNVQLNVLVSYLQVLNAIEQKKQYELATQNTILQESRVKKMITAGALPGNAIVDIETQKSNEEKQLSLLESQINASYAALKAVMGMSPEIDIHIVSPDLSTIPLDTMLPNLDEVMSSAINMRSDVKSATLKAASAQKDVLIAKSYKYPNLSFFSQIGTNYSNQFMDRILSDTIFAPIGITAVNNELVLGGYPSYTTKNTPLFKQLGQNMNYAIGLNLSIPIYNKRSAWVNMQRSQLLFGLQNLQKEQLENDVKNRVNDAYLKTIAAKNTLLSIERNIYYTQKTYELALQKLEKGAVTQQEVNLANNAVAVARLQRVQAQYEYLFNRKVLDYYLGKKISF